ncbi:hypothetical protein C900_05445 [Fulvivirga imtechensis AK7]|uniref:CAAX prenyl protease 2/Lysostaphin resistance protein A-like domain-containing protein n=2 Tax=Fulvivirga TaxID=396811 RepID=L8JJH3_9BACT|nr:hypothetical protein C900_05445 [Fulvivirga imtechensis AK7]
MSPTAIKGEQPINWLEIFALLAIQLGFSYLVVDQIGLFFGNKSHTTSFMDLSSIEIVSAILLAPFIEEVCFRSFLSGKAKHAWGLPLMLFVATLAFKHLGIIFLLFAFLIIVTVTVLLTKKRTQVFLLRKHYNKTFFFTCVIFALCHLGVIDDNVNPVAGFFLILMAFIPISLIFGYIRIKYGLMYSIITHSLNNIAVLSLNLLIY